MRRDVFIYLFNNLFILNKTLFTYSLTHWYTTCEFFQAFLQKIHSAVVCKRAPLTSREANIFWNCIAFFQFLLIFLLFCGFLHILNNFSGEIYWKLINLTKKKRSKNKNNFEKNKKSALWDFLQFCKFPKKPAPSETPRPGISRKHKKAGPINHVCRVGSFGWRRSLCFVGPIAKILKILRRIGVLLLLQRHVSPVTLLAHCDIYYKKCVRSSPGAVLSSANFLFLSGFAVSDCFFVLFCISIPSSRLKSVLHSSRVLIKW